MHPTLFINKRRKIERLKVLLFFLKVLVFRNEVRNLANDHPLNYQEVLFTRFLFKKPAKKDLKMKSDIVILRQNIFLNKQKTHSLSLFCFHLYFEM